MVQKYTEKAGWQGGLTAWLNGVFLHREHGVIKPGEQMTDNPIQLRLVALAGTLARHAGRSEATLSNKIAGHARLFQRLRAGHGCTVTTADRALAWFDENWPADLEWPRDIPRPSKSKRAA